MAQRHTQLHTHTHTLLHTHRHTHTDTHTHTRQVCLSILVPWAGFIRVCCWSDKVARFQLSRPHMSARGQSNYWWWSRWWWIQENTLQHLHTWALCCSLHCRCEASDGLMVMLFEFSLALRGCIEVKENFKPCGNLVLWLCFCVSKSVISPTLIWSPLIDSHPPRSAAS